MLPSVTEAIVNVIHTREEYYQQIGKVRSISISNRQDTASQITSSKTPIEINNSSSRNLGYRIDSLI